MKTHTIVFQLVIAIILAAPGATFATVIEIGDLNIIDDAGNPSDGLRYLDMTFSDGLTSAAALTNAQATYLNARLATPAEFDDLFAAAGIAYDGSLTASDSFTVGASATLSTGTNYDGGVLSSQLGFTGGTTTRAWSDPDGSIDVSTTRDYLLLTSIDAFSLHNTVSAPAVGSSFGWLLVSPVPEPSTVFLVGIGTTAVLGRRLGSRRHRTRR